MVDDELHSYWSNHTLLFLYSHHSGNTLTGAVNQQSGLLTNQQAPGSYLLGLCSTYASILFFLKSQEYVGYMLQKPAAHTGQTYKNTLPHASSISRDGVCFLCPKTDRTCVA